MSKTIIDSHVHLDLIYQNTPDRVEWLESHDCTVVSWAFGEEIVTVADLNRYLTHQTQTITTLHDHHDLPCYFLTGIHPRNISVDLKPEDVTDLLTPHLEHPLCLGIGEIGLETADLKEKEILMAQLELGQELNKDRHISIGVHTPRENKPSVTGQILQLLDAYSGLQRVIVVDHCTPETLGKVLDIGYMAGVTLSPPKTSLSELQQMLKDHPDAEKRLMCNTDSGSEFYEDLVVAAGTGCFSQKRRNCLFRENAACFYGIMDCKK